MLRLLLFSFWPLGILDSPARRAEDPVQWTLAFDSKAAAPGSHVLAKLTGTIQPHWHVYSMTTPPGGPNPTTASIADNPAVAGFKIYQSKPVRKLDPELRNRHRDVLRTVCIAVRHRAEEGRRRGPGGYRGQRALSILQRHDLPAAEEEVGDGGDRRLIHRRKAAAIVDSAGYTLVPTACAIGITSSVRARYPDRASPASEPRLR